MVNASQCAHPASLPPHLRPLAAAASHAPGGASFTPRLPLAAQCARHAAANSFAESLSIQQRLRSGGGAAPSIALPSMPICNRWR